MTEAEHRLEAGFPNVEAGLVPAGDRVLVQLYTVPEKTKGGLILAAESRDKDQYTTLFGRVVALGDAAFRAKATGERYPGYPWFSVGDYVRVPRFGGDLFKQGDTTFGVYDDDAVVAVVTNPVAFV